MATIFLTTSSDGALGANFSENLNRNSYIFIQENALEKSIWKMATVLSLPQCVNFVNTPRPEKVILHTFTNTYACKKNFALVNT